MAEMNQWVIAVTHGNDLCHRIEATQFVILNMEVGDASTDPRLGKLSIDRLGDCDSVHLSHETC